MKIDKKEFIQVLCKEAKKQNIVLSEDMLEKFEMYKNLLLEWNEKINLTAITDDYEIIMKHFIDCLECVKYIGDEVKSVIDVGTGAGFPGIVLAIYFPDKEFTLLDALNKRLVFLEDVVNKLSLKNVKLIHGRAEETVRINDLYESYDVAVSRAVAQLPVLLEYISPYVKVKGKCLVMKGDSVEDEIKLAGNAINILNLKITNKYFYSYTVENEEYKRSILDIEKIKETPKKYPRNYGKIKKKPL